MCVYIIYTHTHTLRFLFLKNQVCYETLARQWESSNCPYLNAHGARGCTVCLRP